jgi:hypothetical protein
MRKYWKIRSAFVALVVGVLWAFVGIERIVGDHEIGVTWEAFLKHHPSYQVIFENPGSKGLELMHFEKLSPAEQASFVEFCRIRFGTSDRRACQTILISRIY